jgi:hypothetical protein
MSPPQQGTVMMVMMGVVVDDDVDMLHIDR